VTTATLPAIASIAPTPQCLRADFGTRVGIYPATGEVEVILKPVPETPLASPADAGARPRRVGRPPRISRERIAEAAHQIGLGDLTLKAVADQLGVSIAGLYHHIDGKDDLMRLAAEYSATRVQLPEDRGQHWALWLLEWAIYNRNAFVAEPTLLVQYLDGAISAEAIADNVDTILGLLVAQGFTIREAMEAYGLVSSCAVGAAVNTIHDRESTRGGRPILAEHHRVLAQRQPDELPHLRALVAELATGPLPSFTDKITTVLVGVAVRRGEDASEVVRLIDAAAISEEPAARVAG
jgi:AcrR family transcriptional regulator